MTETPNQGRGPRADSSADAAERSRAADVSMEARASARSFVERLAARTPDTERYEDQGEFARGGMGSIRRVQDTVLRRTLAMKVLLEREADDDPDAASSAEVMLARFLEEAQVTGQLDHPGVVPVHDMGVDASGRVWFTMRLVKGRNFEEILELVHAGREGWTLTRAVQSLLRVCEAMAFAHSKGVVHRDLKPANVMVGRFGETYVMDWGLARVAGAPELADTSVRAHASDSTTIERKSPARGPASSHSPHLTMAGSIVGTPAYMAPEQARGEVDRVDERSDVYAVGSMLYHLLAGHRPFVPPGTKRNALEVLRAVVDGPPERIARRDAPPELVAICDKAMARAQDARYATMLALAEDLQAYLEGRVVRAHRTGARAEFAKWVGRNKLAASALATAGVLALGGLGTIAWITNAKNAELATARDAAVMESYGSNLSAASACLSLDAVGEARRRLEACDPDLRGWDWEHLALAAQPCVKKLPIGNEPIRALVWRPDGAEFIARIGERDELRSAEDGRLLATLPGEIAERSLLDWSPDGTRIVMSGKSGRIRLLDRATMRDVWSIQGHGFDIVSVQFSPTGALIYSAAGRSDLGGFRIADEARAENGRVRAWNAADGSAAFVLGGPGPMAGGIALDATGRRLLTVDSQSTVRIFDTLTRELVATRRMQGSIPSLAAFVDDGVLVGSATSGVQRWSADLETVGASLDAAASLLGLTTEWSLGKHHLAGRRPGGSIRIFDRTTLEEVGVQRLDASESSYACFEPESDLLATCGKNGTVVLWNPELSQAAFEVERADWTIASTEFAPGGEVLVRATTNGEVGLVETSTGRPLGSQRQKSGRYRGSAIAPDGTRILVVHEARAHVQALPTLVEEHSAGGAWSAAAAHTGGFMLVSEQGDLVELDRVGALRERAKLPRAAECVVLACDPGGEWAAVGAKDGAVFLHRRGAGATAIELAAGSASIVALDLDGANAWLTAADAGGTLRRWSLESRAEIATRELAGVPFLALDRAEEGSRFFTVGNDGLLRVWEHASLRAITTLAQGMDAKSVAASPDGRRVAVELEGGRTRILETRATDLHSEARVRHIATTRAARARVTQLAQEVGSLREVERLIEEESRSDPQLGAAARAPIQALREEARRLHRASVRVLQQRDEGLPAYRAAREQAERVWRMEPERHIHAEALALAYVRTGEPERALELLAREFASEADRPGVLLLRGLVDARAGNTGAARAAAQRARELRRSRNLERGEDWSALVSELEAALK